MFDQLKNLAGLMGQAKELRAKMEAMQAELGRRSATGEAGAGAVRVTMNGRFEVLRVQIDPAMVAALAGAGSQADRQMVEELTAAAINDAVARVQQVIREEMTRATGLNLPGMLPGM